MAKRGAKARQRKVLTRKRPDPKPGHRNAVKARSSQRVLDAFELRKLGHSYKAIGEILGITKQSAHELVTRHLDELRTETKLVGEQLRQLELERLDEMLVGCMPKAQKGDEGAIRSVIRIMQRRAALEGYDLAGSMGPHAPTARGVGTVSPNGEVSFSFEVMGGDAPPAGNGDPNPPPA